MHYCVGRFKNCQWQCADIMPTCSLLIKNKIPGDRLTTADMKLTEKAEEISEKGKPETSFDNFLSNVIFFQPTEAPHKCVICNQELPNIKSSQRCHYCSFCEIFSWQFSLRDEDWSCPLGGEQASRKRERDCNGNALDSIGNVGSGGGGGGGTKRCPPLRNARANPTRNVPRTRMARRSGEINHPYNTRNRKLELIKRKASQELLMMEPQGLAAAVAGEKGSTKKAAFCNGLKQPESEKAAQKQASGRKLDGDATLHIETFAQEENHLLSKQIKDFKALSVMESESTSQHKTDNNILRKKVSDFFAFNGTQKGLGGKVAGDEVETQGTGGREKTLGSPTRRALESDEGGLGSTRGDASKMAAEHLGSVGLMGARKEGQASSNDHLSASSHRTTPTDRGRQSTEKSPIPSSAIACEHTDDLVEKAYASSGSADLTQTTEASEDDGAYGMAPSDGTEAPGQVPTEEESQVNKKTARAQCEKETPKGEGEGKNGTVSKSQDYGAPSESSSHISSTSASGEARPKGSSSPGRGTTNRDAEPDTPVQQSEASGTQQHQTTRSGAKSRQVRQSAITNHPYHTRKGRVTGTKMKGMSNDSTVESSVNSVPLLGSEAFSYEINFPKDFKLELEGNNLRGESSSMSVRQGIEDDASTDVTVSALVRDVIDKASIADTNTSSELPRRLASASEKGNASYPASQQTVTEDRSASKQEDLERKGSALKNATAAEGSTAPKTDLSAEKFLNAVCGGSVEKAKGPSARSLGHSTLASEAPGTGSAVSVESSASASSGEFHSQREAEEAGSGSSAASASGGPPGAGGISEGAESSQGEEQSCCRCLAADAVVSRDGEVFRLSEISPSPDDSLSSLCSVWSGRVPAAGPPDSSSPSASPKESEKFFSLDETVGTEKLRSMVSSSESSMSSLYSFYFGRNSPTAKSSAFSLLAPKESKKFFNFHEASSADEGLKLQDISSSSDTSISSIYGLYLGGNGLATKDSATSLAQRDLDTPPCSEEQTAGRDGSMEPNGRRILSRSSLSSIFSTSSSSETPVPSENSASNSLLAPGGDPTARSLRLESASAAEGERALPGGRGGQGSEGRLAGSREADLEEGGVPGTPCLKQQ